MTTKLPLPYFPREPKWNPMNPHRSQVERAVYFEDLAAAYRERLKVLHARVKTHNDECESRCGIGEHEGVACGYRPYFPRHCPNCTRHEMLVDEHGERLDVAVDLPPPNDAGGP